MVASTPAPGTADEWFTGFDAPDPVDAAKLLNQVRADLRGRYEVRGYLGRGAYATVWEAFDAVSREVVAVKRFDTRPRDGRSFYRELRVMFRLVHPRVVRIINLLENVGSARYLILEHCAGGSLRAAMGRSARQGERCPYPRVTDIARQLAEGLATAHDLGLVHRDLKPENVLFDASDPGPVGGRAGVKLADFGLTRALQHSGLAGGPTTMSLSGSPAYMAPEQFAGSFAAASDMYALGIILFELLHGTVPFAGTPESLAYHHLRCTPTLDPGLAAPWNAILPKLLEKEPARRLRARELLAELSVERGTPTQNFLSVGKSASRANASRPYVLVIAGHKGGSGRTTAALALAWCWGRRGLRVGLLDAAAVPAAQRIAAGKDGCCSWNNVRLLKGLSETSEVSEFDLVVIDAPSLTDPAAVEVLSIADGVLLIAQAEATALRTTRVALRSVEIALNRNSRLKRLGVLLPAFDSNDPVQQQLREQLRTQFGTQLLEPSIPVAAEVRDWARRPGGELPEGSGRLAYEDVAQRIAHLTGLRSQFS